MHDPKLSAAVAHHQLLLSESMMDKLPSSSHRLRQHTQFSTNHLDYIQHRYSKAAMLPRTTFSAISPYQDSIGDSRNHGRLLPLFHRLKDVGSTTDILQYPGYESAFSEVASQYRYSDLLHARRLYESVYGDQTLPLSLSAISRRLAGSSDYLFPGQGSTRRSGVVIKDVSEVPPSLSLQLPSISLSSSSSSPVRLADSLSLSPLHVSTTVSSSPLSSESSPSPLRRSSVSPDSRWTDPQIHQHAITRPSMMSSLSLPGDLALYDERALQGDRNFPPTALPSSCTFPPSLWHPSSSLTQYSPAPPPLLCVCSPHTAAYESRASIGHLLDQYVTSPPALAHHHHLHHHLSRQHLVRDSFYSGSASGSLDSRSSPGKELPTKLLKQDRARGRQELSAALEADKEHAERLNNLKKSASTQTQFSSFNCENLPPPPYYTAHDTGTPDKLLTNPTHGHGYPSHLPPPPLHPSFVQYSHATSSYHSPLSVASSHTPAVPVLPPHPSSFHTTALLSPPQAPSKPNLAHTSPSPPVTPTLPLTSLTQIRKGSSPPALQTLPPYPSGAHGCSPPPPPQYPTRGHLDEQHTPLNLSLSSTPPASSLIPQTRTSAVTSLVSTQTAETSESCKGGPVSEEAAKSRLLSDKNCTSPESKAKVSDEAIEEHFRRSLGKSYHEPSPPKKVAVHVSEKICSVDDHFARALGDQMWTEIKARSEPPSFDSLPGSVDAHFAKALGAAMWKKLKAENKLADDVTSTNPAQTQPQQLEDQHNQPKSPPSSPLQKSLLT